MHDIKHVFLSLKSRCTTELIGSYGSRFHGSGLEFSDIRAYDPGDSLKRIDWRSSARTWELATKLFQEERRVHILFVIPDSSTWRFGSQGRTKLDTLLQVVGLIGLSAYSQWDRIEVVSNNESLSNQEVRQWGMYRCLDFITEMIESSSQENSLGQILDGLIAKNTSQKIIITLSDERLDDPTIKKIQLLHQKNDIMHIDIHDSLERSNSSQTLFSVKKGWWAKAQSDKSTKYAPFLAVSQDDDVSLSLQKAFSKRS